MNVARQVLTWAGVSSSEVTTLVGRGTDWLTIGLNNQRHLDAILLDHRGTIYQDDLAAAEPYLQGAAWYGAARIDADNVLLPGAPLFLAYVSEPEGDAAYDIAIHDVPEYLQPELDDWVVICSSRPGRVLAGNDRDGVSVPPELRGWNEEIDAVSWASMAGKVDWEGLQRRLSPPMRSWRQRRGF
eukprot:TRINITY_DN36103_c0_g1_i1.p1 TRINITY_DN36103_c0_g1~~TRINITY_DN36103_c0_g1_i1.p1  ORF type:complete len:185 (-),score=17.75 TRINITY_DN36103_c0_g1_i1:938-1492(-)